MRNTFPAMLPDLPAGGLIPSGIPEADALAILGALAHRFGWAYAIWNRDTVHESLDDLDWAEPDQRPRRLTDEEWKRVTETHTWRTTIADIAYTRVADEDLLADAILEAGVVCAECQVALHDPPSVTGRLCQAHRTGPAGQPAVVNPATEGLYWLDGDSLIYAPIDWEHSSPRKDAGEPADWAELDPLATYQAQQAETALRALPTPALTSDDPRFHGPDPASR